MIDLNEMAGRTPEPAQTSCSTAGQFRCLDTVFHAVSNSTLPGRGRRRVRPFVKLVLCPRITGLTDYMSPIAKSGQERDNNGSVNPMTDCRER